MTEVPDSTKKETARRPGRGTRSAVDARWRRTPELTPCTLISGRRAQWRLVGLAAGLCVSLAPGSTGYVFLRGEGVEHPDPVTSEFGLRWSPDDWGPGETLVWEIARDPAFDPFFDSPEGAIPYAQRALDAWSAIPTADVLWELSGVGEESETGRDGPKIDGRSTVFIDSDDPDPGYAAVWLINLTPAECDVNIGVDNEWLDGIEPESRDEFRELIREDKVRTLVHEFGHCLGLGHAGDLSISARLGQAGDFRRLIHPYDPTMSYGEKSWGPDYLTADDMIGVSLLRPARSWTPRTGKISGLVTIGDEPAPYMHVWALPAGKRALQDRVGVFSDAEGAFLIEGLNPGDYALWVQPIGSQSSNAWVTERGGPTDLDDTILGRLVRVRSGRTTENIAVSMRRGRTPRPPPERAPPRIERGSGTLVKVLRETVCSGIRIEAENPWPADGPLWFSRRDFQLARDRWLGTTLVVEWHEEARNVMFDWAGPYRNWTWQREEEGDAEYAELFQVWEAGSTFEEAWRAHSPVLDVSVADYRIERAGPVVRHTVDIAWPESAEASLRFRSDDDTCNGEPLVVCGLGGCEVR